MIVGSCVWRRFEVCAPGFFFRVRELLFVTQLSLTKLGIRIFRVEWIFEFSEIIGWKNFSKEKRNRSGFRVRGNQLC